MVGHPQVNKHGMSLKRRCVYLDRKRKSELPIQWVIHPTGSICVSAYTEFHWEEVIFFDSKEVAFCLLFVPVSMRVFYLLWFDSLMKRAKVYFFSATRHWHIGWWNNYLRGLDMCGICECNTVSLTWRLVFLASIFWKNIFFKENTNTLTHFIRSCDESNKQAAFDVLFSGIVWTHSTFQVKCHQGHLSVTFSLLATCSTSSSKMPTFTCTTEGRSLEFIQ